MTKLVVIQGSRSSNSRTSIVVEEAVKLLKEKNIEHTLIDIRDVDMEFCDGRPINEYNEQLQKLYKQLEEADAYIIGMPVYQTSVSGPLKNFLDVMSKAMYYKTVGLIVNSGGIRSYYAGADMLKILSYELWTVMVQPTVHTYPADFEDGQLKNEKAVEKLHLLIENVLRYSKVEPAKPEK